jgi:hypothetical protein
MTMKKNSLAMPSLAALALVMTGTAAMAESWKLNCFNVGANMPEPLADRDGHWLSVPPAACLIQGGPMDGGVVTQNAIWDNDTKGASLISGDGVARKPGSIAVYRNTSGSLTWVMQDGKPAGYTGSGKGVYLLSTGSASSLTGKSFSWVVRPTGPRSFSADVTLD